MNHTFKQQARALDLHRIPGTRFLDGPHGRVDKRAVRRTIRKIGAFEFFTAINTEQCEWRRHKSRFDLAYPLSRPDGGRGYILVQQCVKTKDHRGDHQFPEDPYALYIGAFSE